MRIEIRDRWVKALRSGEYERGEGKLLDDEGRFCALGVLCDTLGQEVEPFSASGKDNHGDLYLLLEDVVGRYIPVMMMNDKGATFPAIADWIEENVPVETDGDDD